MSVKAGVDEELDRLRQTSAGKSVQLGRPSSSDTR
jgi:hypothetical protein